MPKEHIKFCERLYFTGDALFKNILPHYPKMFTKKGALSSRFIFPSSCPNFSFCGCRSNKVLAESLDQAEDPDDPLVNRLLRMMATSAMSQAVYFATGAQSQDQYQSKSQFYHYGKTEAHMVSMYRSCGRTADCNQNLESFVYS